MQYTWDDVISGGMSFLELPPVSPDSPVVGAGGYQGPFQLFFIFHYTLQCILFKCLTTNIISNFKTIFPDAINLFGLIKSSPSVPASSPSFDPLPSPYPPPFLSFLIRPCKKHQLIIQFWSNVKIPAKPLKGNAFLKTVQQPV